MPTRRTFLESAAVVSAAPLAPTLVLGDVDRRAANMGVIYDSRYGEARVFGFRAQQWGAPARSIEADITQLWRGELEGRWKSTPVAVAGLTERPALFMLEQLAWDYGLRVGFQAEHEPRKEGGWAHRVTRSGKPSLQGELDAAGARWPDILADQMLTTPHRLASADVSPSGAAMAAYLNEPAKLYSWIIAPNTAVASI